jgi:hypothetical protein
LTYARWIGIPGVDFESHSIGVVSLKFTNDAGVPGVRLHLKKRKRK